MCIRDSCHAFICNIIQPLYRSSLHYLKQLLAAFSIRIIFFPQIWNQFIHCYSNVPNVIEIRVNIDKLCSSVGSHETQDSLVPIWHINIKPKTQPAKLTPTLDVYKRQPYGSLWKNQKKSCAGQAALVFQLY